MKKPWSISTTIRNPERLRDFLAVLKQLEGQPFNSENQIKYQIKFVLSMEKVTSIAICDYVALLEKQKGGGEE
jgi:hypothetical protein